MEPLQKRKRKNVSYKEVDSDVDSNDELESKKKLRKKKTVNNRESDDSASSNSEFEESDPDYEEETEKKEQKNKNSVKEKPLSEYEKKAQEHRNDKLAFLKSLKIDEVKEEFADTLKQLTKRPERAKNKKLVMPPREKIMRESKVDIDLSEEAISARAQVEAKAEARAMAMGEVKQPMPEELSIEEILEYGSYESFLENFSDLKHSEDITHTIPLNNLRLDKERSPKVVSDAVKSIDFYPSCEELILCVGGQHGQVGLWNVNSGDEPFLLKPHQQSVTHVKFNPLSPNQLVSSSIEGNLRCADLVNKSYNEIYADKNGVSLTYFEYLSATSLLVSQKDGKVSILDTLERRVLVKKHKCNDFHIRTVSVHPKEKTYFITAHANGSINLWDLRNLTTKPIIELLEHKKAVNSAFFSNFSGKHILSTSTDDTVCLFDSSRFGSFFPLQRKKRHRNPTMKATWLPRSDHVFVIGSMVYPRKIELYDNYMKNIFNFCDVNMTCQSAVNLFHPYQSALAGGTSSGKVYLFTLEDPIVVE